MFPLNRVHAAHFSDWNDWRPLLKTAKTKEVGVFAIKVVAKRLWESESEHKYDTWYEPFDQAGEIERSVWYTLTQDITSAVMPGELKLWPMMIDAANRFESLSQSKQKEITEEVSGFKPLYASWMD
jgi:hypothetical protein